MSFLIGVELDGACQLPIYIDAYGCAVQQVEKDPARKLHAKIGRIDEKIDSIVLISTSSLTG
jgi:hypothetical protein